MIDITQHMLALQFKGVVKLFDENYTAAWKTLENLCIDENLFFSILRSNMKMTNMMITKLAFLRFTRCTLLALRSAIYVSEIFRDNKFLWLNKAVKYQNKPMLIEEFLKVGIFHFKQLTDSDGEIITYDDLALLNGMHPNNYSFIKHVKLISAIPTHWIGEASTSGELFWVSKEKAKELISFLGKSNKTVYKHLRSKSRLLPIKQQRKWCDALQILPNHIDWNKIYENNYFATNETKLRFFQIR